MRDGRAREQLERRIVVHLAVADDAAVPVRRVLAQADVGDEKQLGEARPQRPQRLLHDPVLEPRAGTLVVLVLRDAEQDHRADTDADDLLDLPHQPVDRVPREGRQTLVRQRLRRDEERQHEVVERERRLADEVA